MNLALIIYKSCVNYLGKNWVPLAYDREEKFLDPFFDMFKRNYATLINKNRTHDLSVTFGE